MNYMKEINIILTHEVESWSESESTNKENEVKEEVILSQHLMDTKLERLTLTNPGCMNWSHISPNNLAVKELEFIGDIA